MTSILESVEWGERALSLLTRCLELENGNPAVMIIRHSEVDYQTMEDLPVATLTETGKAAALEFGTKLPSDRSYRIYHSTFDRAKKTAENIVKGLDNIGVEVELYGEHPEFNMSGNRDRIVEFIWDSTQRNRRWVHDWFSGRLSPSIFPPSLETAKAAAAVMIHNLQDAGPETFDVYACHAEMVLLFMFHWLGEIPERRWARYLNGFVLQLSDDSIVWFDGDRRKEVLYPHWWNF